MLKVFLAEDEVIIREALRDSIPWEQHGFIFAGEASDGEMALEMVRTLKPDVVITDIRMPFMDGLTFSRYVSEELPDTKIIIISGYDDFEYARQAVELHADRFLLKPVTKADMISTLEDTRRRIEAERAKRLQDLQKLQSAEDPFSSLELTGFDPMVLGSFIEIGRAEDVDSFTDRFILSLHGAEQSMLFKNYLLVSIRISAANALQSADLSADALAELVPDLPMDYTGEELKNYLRTVLKQVTHKVNQLDLDFNGHVNNRSYVSIAMLTVPDAFLTTHRTNRFVIHWLHESYLDENMTCTLRQVDENTYVHLIKREDGETAAEIFSVWEPLTSTVDVAEVAMRR